MTTKNQNQSRQHHHHNKEEATLSQEAMETLSQEASDIFENASKSAEALAADATRDMSEEDAEATKKKILAKELQKNFRDMAYPIVGGFQPSQKRYWADVGVRAAANTLFLATAVIGAAVVLRKKTGETGENVMENNPFNTNVTASERPSRRGAATA